MANSNKKPRKVTDTHLVTRKVTDITPHPYYAQVLDPIHLYNPASESKSAPFSKYLPIVTCAAGKKNAKKVHLIHGYCAFHHALAINMEVIITVEHVYVEDIEIILLVLSDCLSPTFSFAKNPQIRRALAVYNALHSFPEHLEKLFNCQNKINQLADRLQIASSVFTDLNNNLIGKDKEKLKRLCLGKQNPRGVSVKKGNCHKPPQAAPLPQQTNDNSTQNSPISTKKLKPIQKKKQGQHVQKGLFD